jgi:hypothetical protein
MTGNAYTNPYRALVAAGVPIDHHESDLYCLATPEAWRIVGLSGWSHSTFTSQIDGRTWIDLPFGYEPFWCARVAERVTP